MAVSQFKQLDVRLSLAGLAGLLLGTFTFLIIDALAPDAAAMPADQTVRLLLLLACQAGSSLLLLRYAVDSQITAPLRRLTAAVEQGLLRSTKEQAALESALASVPDNELRTLSTALLRLPAAADAGPDLPAAAAQEQALQKAKNEIESLSYAISHDLRAPIRTIVGFAELLLEDYKQTLPQPGQEFIQKIALGAERLDQMVKDLLIYSRLNRAEIKLQPIGLEHPVNKVLAELSTAIKKCSAEITSEGLERKVLAHRETLEQVFTSILTNALKFVPVGVNPKIKIKAVDASFNKVRLLVEDNGIGIDSKFQPRIFNMFERLNSSELYSGTGAGLALAKLGINRLGGQIGVESAPDSGASFWIELDAA